MGMVWYSYQRDREGERERLLGIDRERCSSSGEWWVVGDIAKKAWKLLFANPKIPFFSYNSNTILFLSFFNLKRLRPETCAASPSPSRSCERALIRSDPIRSDLNPSRWKAAKRSLRRGQFRMWERGRWTLLAPSELSWPISSSCPLLVMLSLSVCGSAYCFSFLDLSLHFLNFF